MCKTKKYTPRRCQKSPRQRQNFNKKLIEWKRRYKIWSLNSLVKKLLFWILFYETNQSQIVNYIIECIIFNCFLSTKSDHWPSILCCLSLLLGSHNNFKLKQSHGIKNLNKSNPKKSFCQPLVQLYPLTEMIPQLLIKCYNLIWRPLIHLRES